MKLFWKHMRAAWAVILVLSLAVPACALAEDSAGRAPVTGILEYSWAWYEGYTPHAEAIDAYNQDNYMELSALSDVGIPFIAFSEYEELDKAHADGRVEGNLPYSGFAAFVERAGSIVEFGCEYERDFDGMSIAELKGDLVRESARMDLSSGHMTNTCAVTRGEELIARDSYEYRLMPDGGALAIAFWADRYSFQGDERNQVTAVYMRIADEAMEFILAASYTGTGFEAVPLGDGEMTPEQAASALEAAGFSIQSRGTVREGALALEG